ncbi:MAG: hypothetical protein JW722_08285 [Demequinaceae bacterium]|nr:hypothetical protein [Demequinaceae bacterium]
MNDLAALLRAEMAHEATGSRDGFDPAALLDTIRRKARGKRRVRATVQAFGGLALLALTGGLAWLTLGHQGEPVPGASPNPSGSIPVSPSPSPSATPSPSASGTIPEPWDVPRDDAGLPIAPQVDDATLAQVGPGWILAEYTSGAPPEGTPSVDDTRFFLVSPDRGIWEVGRASAEADMQLWRPERHELIYWDSDLSWVLNLASGELEPFADASDNYEFLGMLPDGREVWLSFDTHQSVALKGIAVYTPGATEPDLQFPRPSVRTNVNWRIYDDHLLAIPDANLGDAYGGTSVWEVYLDGSVVERVLTLPPGLGYCADEWTILPGTLVWNCSANNESEHYTEYSTWILSMDGGSATEVDVPLNFWDHQNQVATRLPGVDVDVLEAGFWEDTFPVRWFAFELPYSAP